MEDMEQKRGSMMNKNETGFVLNVENLLKVEELIASKDIQSTTLYASLPTIKFVFENSVFRENDIFLTEKANFGEINSTKMLFGTAVIVDESMPINWLCVRTVKNTSKGQDVSFRWIILAKNVDENEDK